MIQSSELRAGELVEVRSKEEILSTLDKNGQLDGLPFMPEMFEHCGKRFRVFKRAHKTCDPPNGLRGRRMLNTVHLEGLRCNGAFHGGCQARCLVFWKEAWLRPVASQSVQLPVLQSFNGDLSLESQKCSERDVLAASKHDAEEESNDTVYVCQSTQVAQASQALPWWDVRQYVEDYTSGNVRASQLAASFLLLLYSKVVSAGIGLGSPLRWIYDSIQKIKGGTRYPWRSGKVPRGAKTPALSLDLQPGELVRVRSYEEILETLTAEGHNRGMVFDAEMVPYCGGTYRVLDRVNTIVNEKTGKLQHLKNDCIMLDQVTCLACYAKYRRFCPRRIYPFWREIWLERVSSNNECETVR